MLKIALKKQGKRHTIIKQKRIILKLNLERHEKVSINVRCCRYGSFCICSDKNICQYTKSGSGPSKLVPTGEIVIGIGFLHDVVYQIVNNGYTNIGMTSPSSGTSYEIGATAIFKGAKNLDNAKKFIEFALSPDCVNLAQDNGSYQFLVIDNAKPVEVAIKNGLDKIETMVYNFDDAKTNGPKYYAEFFEVISKDDRVKTK